MIGLCVVVFQRFALGDQRRFVTHGGKAFRMPGAALEAGRRRAHRSTARWRRCCRSAPSSSSRCRRSGARRSSDGEFTLDNFRRIFDEARVTEAISTSLVVSLIAVAIALPVGFVASTLLLRSRIPGWHAHDARPHRRPAARHPGGGVRRRVPAPVHAAAARALRQPVGRHPRVPDADAPVHDPDADVGDGRARRRPTSRRRG